MISLSKYIGEGTTPDPRTGQRLFWPGTAAGFPVRGKTVPPLLKEHERKAVERHVFDYYCRKFCLWEAKDQADFIAIQDKIANGWCLERKRTDRWDEEHQHLIVVLEWIQIFGELATTKRPPLPEQVVKRNNNLSSLLD